MESKTGSFVSEPGALEKRSTLKLLGVLDLYFYLPSKFNSTLIINKEYRPIIRLHILPIYSNPLVCLL